MHCTRLLSGSNIFFRFCHVGTDAGLRQGRGELADCAHGPVLYIFLIQNRELQYASCATGQAGKCYWENPGLLDVQMYF